MMDEEMKRALRRKALGYDAEEVVEEYAGADAELTLVKRKVTRKNVPPDLTALKMLAEGEGGWEDMSDEELLRERERLLALLKKEKDIEEKNKK